MIAIMENASYSSSTGTVLVNLKTSTINGYPNNVSQYTTYGVMSVPLPNQRVNVDQQSRAQVQITGYENTIADSSFSINAGETAIYSTTWYNVTSNSGIYMQQANNSHQENAMMGQSTNEVLKDIMSLVVDLTNIIFDVVSGFNEHIHAVAGPNTAVPTVPWIPPTAALAKVQNDVTYIGNNENLAKTGFTPYP